MTSACFSRGHTGFSRNATLVATVNPPALAGGVFNILTSREKEGILSLLAFLYMIISVFLNQLKL